MKLNDIFGDDWLIDKPKRKVVERRPPDSKPITIDLYRGFVLDLDKAQREDGKIVLSPKKSEQGLMWFTHKYVSVNVAGGGSSPDYIEYAISSAKKHDQGDQYLLTYPLKCIKHFQTKVYDDGSTYDVIPDEILDKTIPTENCRFHMGIELPQGWVFTYKYEKFIGCGIDILIDESMLTKL